MKKIVILFNGPHLSYSPTTIGLYDLLSKYFEVTIISQSPKRFNNQGIENRNVIYIKDLETKTQYRTTRIIFILKAFFGKHQKLFREKNLGIDAYHQFKFISNYLANDNPDLVIAVDFKNLFFTQLLHNRVEFLSLEISPNDFYYTQCNFENINSVIIQTKERYKYLFNNKHFETFYIQNAPVYVETPINNSERSGLVYCGTAIEEFGFYHCLEFLREFKKYHLTVKGAILEKNKLETEYNDLTLNNQLSVNDEYLDDNEVVDYLRQFKIGFCFYNFDIPHVNNFNYISAPSGKMFKYMAAGVPVIGQNILGLKPVKDFDCGVLIEDLKPESIRKAIDRIESNFDYYSQNCLKAAEHYSFDKMAQSFLSYLLEKI